jgi:hypothetical protein
MNLTALAYINKSNKVKPSVEPKYGLGEIRTLFYWDILENKRYLSCLGIFRYGSYPIDEIKELILKEIDNG